MKKHTITIMIFFVCFFCLSTAFAEELTIVINDVRPIGDLNEQDGVCDIDLDEEGEQCSIQGAFDFIDEEMELDTYDTVILDMSGVDEEKICVPETIWYCYGPSINLIIQGRTDGVVRTIFDGGGSEKYGLCNEKTILGNVFSFVGVNVTMRGITIRGGKAERLGGGIAAEDTQLTLEGVSIQYNQAGNSEVADDVSGGGVSISTMDPAKPSSLTVSGSSIVNNQARAGLHNSYGGGIYIGAFTTFTMINSTVANNLATAAAETSDIWGGGLLAWTHTNVTISNSTIANNVAANSEVMGKGVAGSGCLMGKAEIKNSIVAMNKSDGFYALCFHEIVSAGNNVIYDRDLATSPVFKAPPESETDVILESGDDAKIALAETLNNNGGPTPTLAITSSDSVAIGVADCVTIEGETLTIDQRGATRVNCNAGAFEYGATESSDEACVDKSDNDGDGDIDCDDSDCASVSACASGDEEKETECADQLDNDGDGVADCDDQDCIDGGFCAVPLEVSTNQVSGGDDDDDGNAADEGGGCSLSTVAAQPVHSIFWMLWMSLGFVFALRQESVKYFV